MEQWAAGQFQDETDDRTLARNAAALGQVECYERLAELKLDEFNETINEKVEKVDD
jgi:hypothetical protein